MSQNRQQRPHARHENLDPASLGLPPGLTDDPEGVKRALEQLNQQPINLLAPVMHIDHIPASYRLAFRAVLFPTDGMRKHGKHLTNGTWYETDGGGYALHKASLRQLAAVAGVSIDTESVPCEINRWIFKATARVRNLDGTWRHVSATKDVDLRDDGPIVPTWQAEAKKRNKTADWRVLKAREHGGRMAEAKAINAAIRSALGLKAAYEMVDASKPFVMPLLIYVPESAAALQMQAAVEFGVVTDIYGPPSGTITPAGPVVDVTAEQAQPAARQLPDYGPDTTPNYTQELERSRQRQPVPRRPPQEDLLAYCDAKGWPAPDSRERWDGLVKHVQGKGRDDFDAFMGAAGPDLDPDW